MAIIKSCCCWRSLRRGCYACGTYTGVYFLLTFIVMLGFIYEERHYYSGESETPKSPSVLEPEELSSTTMMFQLIILGCSSIGVLTSVLLIYGIFKDKKFLLIPWILTVLCSTLVDLAHSLYMSSTGKMIFNPVTAFLYTSDFFLLSLNVYCLLCVISQYQEYNAGRGTADYCRALPVRYIPKPVATVTTCDSSRRNHTNSGQDLPSPSGFTSVDSDRQSSRKHVQFGAGEDISPDRLHAHWKETNSNSNKASDGNGNAVWILPSDNRLPSLDTVPLISTPSPSPTNEKK